jgi:ADP-ribose pyrophosphatase
MPDGGGDAQTEVSELTDDRFDVTVVASERVFEGKVWDIRRDAFDYDGGEPIVREYVDHTGAVAILALDEDDRLLMIKQYRHPVGYREWEIPAGLLDITGENPLAAAKRELAEEADLEASEWSVLSEFSTSPGGSNETIRLYLARVLRPTEQAFDRTEEEADIEVRWASLDEVATAILERRVQNPALTIGVLAARASREGGWTSLGAADEPWPRHPKLQD